MYIEYVPNRNSPPAVLLRESWRENGKTKKRTVANLSALPEKTIQAVRSALKGDVVVAMIADRLLHGDSKLATARDCQKETAATTLGETAVAGRPRRTRMLPGDGLVA